MKGKKWLLILLALVLAGAAVLAACWDAIVMRLVPKAVLSGAVQEAFSALEQRFADSPLQLLAQGYDENGQNTTALSLTVSDTALGEVAYDMTVQTDLLANQLLAQGRVTGGGTSLDVTAYLDRDFAALTSADLLSGGWYGLTYDTFGGDIRSFTLLDMLVPDAAIRQWEGKVQSLQEFMNRSYALPKVPALSREALRSAMLGVLMLKSQVSAQTVTVSGVTLECWQIQYDVTGDQAAQVLSNLIPGAGADSRITAVFSLYEKALVQARFQAAAGDTSVEAVLTLGVDAGADDLSVFVGKTEGGEERTLSAALSTRRQNGRYSEVIRVSGTEISYDWNPETGEMNLTLPQREPVALTLSAAENGVTVRTADFASLIGIQSQRDYDCTMTVSRGAAIEAPAYKNLDKWSWEDLLVLLSGLGSLLGLNLK